MPLLADEFNGLPIQRWIKLVICPFGERAHVGYAFDVANDVSESAVFGAKHAGAPAGLGHHVENIGDGITRAAEIIDSGAAIKKLDELIAVSQKLAA